MAVVILGQAMVTITSDIASEPPTLSIFFRPLKSFDALTSAMTHFIGRKA